MSSTSAPSQDTQHPPPVWQRILRRWPFFAPPLAVVTLAASWGTKPPTPVQAIIGVILGAAVLAAVHHAEIIAHRVGEPFGSLVLAVAVTVIEAGLIITLMIGGDEGSSTVARDTVFSAAMICLNGIVGLSILVRARRSNFAHFNAEGSGAALATIATLATLCLVVPTFTEGGSGLEFSGAQLTFAAIASLVLWATFVANQTGRHRDFFLPVTDDGRVIAEAHADPPSVAATWVSVGFLVASLAGVIGLAKVESPAITSAVTNGGLPASFVGVIIAMVVLLPESIAAVNASRRNRFQTSLNLAYGSSIATIGLTIPTVAIATLWIDTPLELGLSSLQIVILTLTLIVSVLTVVPGRATRLEGAVHLMLFAAFVFLAASP